MNRRRLLSSGPGDPLNAARGCLYGVVIGAAMWTAALCAWWWLSN